MVLSIPIPPFWGSLEKKLYKDPELPKPTPAVGPETPKPPKSVYTLNHMRDPTILQGLGVSGG